MKAKKHLGQHFLTNKHYALRIADQAISTDPTGNLLEIGPGQGFLTQYLLEKDVHLKMVEFDHDMVDHLKSHFALEENQIILNDFLKLNLEELFMGEPFSVVGNFPYNISSQIVFKILSHREKIPAFSGMFQKEVAQRLASQHGTKTYGILSVLLQAFYDVSLVFNISPGNFNPPPKVDSSVIQCIRKEQPLITEHVKMFFSIVKMAFNQRRKMLRNSLKSVIPKDDHSDELSAFLTRRPEQMSVKDFITLTNRIKQET